MKLKKQHGIYTKVALSLHFARDSYLQSPIVDDLFIKLFVTERKKK